VALETTARFLFYWIPDDLSAESHSLFTPRITWLFSREGAGESVAESVSAESICDHEEHEWRVENGIEPFEPGERFLVYQELVYSFFPIRIFSVREWQGLIHWALHREFGGDPDAWAMATRMEALVYDTAGLDGFIEDRLSGRVDWEYNYPLDNPTAMALLRSTHPNFNYDAADLNSPHSDRLFRP